jgi:hypothetical protein
MKIIIKKPISADKVERAIHLIIGDRKNKKNVVKHFGKLKRNIDGNSYQKNAKNEWN